MNAPDVGREQVFAAFDLADSIATEKCGTVEGLPACLYEDVDDWQQTDPGHLCAHHRLVDLLSGPVAV